MTTASRSKKDSPEPARYAVGDKLAFRRGYNAGWDVFEISKITPSGRLVCGPYTLNPDLAVRGVKTFHSPICGEPVTKEIAQDVHRRRLLKVIANTKFEELSAEKLQEIVKVLMSDNGSNTGT